MAQVNICEFILSGHKFFEIKKLVHYVPDSPSSRPDKDGALVVCATCGEVREIWETGETVIRKAGQTKDDETEAYAKEKRGETTGG